MTHWLIHPSHTLLVSLSFSYWFYWLSLGSRNMLKSMLTLSQYPIIHFSTQYTTSTPFCHYNPYQIFILPTNLSIFQYIASITYSPQWGTQTTSTPWVMDSACLYMEIWPTSMACSNMISWMSCSISIPRCRKVIFIGNTPHGLYIDLLTIYVFSYIINQLLIWATSVRVKQERVRAHPSEEVLVDYDQSELVIIVLTFSEYQ